MELVLNTFGTGLSVENGNFVVSNIDGKRMIPVTHITSIQVAKGTQITSDAVFLALENEIEILFVERDGFPQGRVWSPKYGSISTIRKGQLIFSQGKKAVDWIISIIDDKIANQQAFLTSLIGAETATELEKVNKNLEELRKKVSRLKGEKVDDIASKLRGLEGAASEQYFKALDLCLPEDHRFNGRSQHPAWNYSNALLNYAYGILYRDVESALIEAGIDPYIGILHVDQHQRPVLVYDMIEKYRVWADYVVVNLLRQRIVSSEMFSASADGSYWLEGMGKRILLQAMSEYMSQVIKIKGTARTRKTHIDLFAQKLAQSFKSCM